MADPLSAIAGIVGVTDVGVKGINSLRHLYRSYKDAPKKLEQLRNEAPAHWAVMMQLGQVFDAAAEVGDDNLSRVIFELGEQGNAHLIEFDKSLANDDQFDSEARQRQSRRSLVGKKLRHIAQKWQLRSKHSHALAHKRDFENVRESWNSVLLAESTRMQILKNHDTGIQHLASLHKKVMRTEESRPNEDLVVEASSSRTHIIHRCPPSCICNCHNPMRRFPAHLIPNSMRGLWRAMIMASSRYSQLNPYCHECGSAPRAKVAGTVNWRVPKWFGSLTVQFSVSYSLRRGLSYRLKAAQRVEYHIGDIFWCIRNGDTRQLHWLLQTCPAAVNNQNITDGRGPLHLAIDENKPDMITLLLKSGADMAIENDHGVNPAVSFALSVLDGNFPKTEHYELYGKLSTTDTLEDLPEYLGYGTVHKIILNMLEIDLRDYLEGLEKDERLAQIRHVAGWGHTPLHLAVTRDDTEAVKILLSFGAEPNARNSDGRTPLTLLAIGFWSAECFELLVQGGGNLDARDRRGGLAIHDAAYCGSLEFVERYYCLGGDIDLCNSVGETPLMFAAKCNQVAIIERLLEWGADIEGVDSWGFTAFSRAVLNNAHEAMGILLSKNANPYHVDNLGHSLLHWAAESADPRTMEIIQSLEPTFEELDRRNMWNQTPFDMLRQEFRDRWEVWDMFVEMWEKANQSREVTEEA